MTTVTVDRTALESKVKDMYTATAKHGVKSVSVLARKL
jgi:hypothetical protein